MNNFGPCAAPVSGQFTSQSQTAIARTQSSGMPSSTDAMTMSMAQLPTSTAATLPYNITSMPVLESNPSYYTTAPANLLDGTQKVLPTPVQMPPTEMTSLLTSAFDPAKPITPGMIAPPAQQFCVQPAPFSPPTPVDTNLWNAFPSPHTVGSSDHSPIMMGSLHISSPPMMALAGTFSETHPFPVNTHPKQPMGVSPSYGSAMSGTGINKGVTGEHNFEDPNRVVGDHVDPRAAIGGEHTAWATTKAMYTPSALTSQHAYLNASSVRPGAPVVASMPMNFCANSSIMNDAASVLSFTSTAVPEPGCHSNASSSTTLHDKEFAFRLPTKVLQDILGDRSKTPSPEKLTAQSYKGKKRVSSSKRSRIDELKPQKINKPPKVNNPAKDEEDAPNVNSPPKVNKCPFEGCNKVMSRSSNLISHYKTHFQEKKWRCPDPGCGTAFLRKHDLKRHYGNTHEKLRPYQCEICPSRFNRHDALIRHYRIDGGNGPCNKALIEKGSESAQPLLPRQEGMHKLVAEYYLRYPEKRPSDMPAGSGANASGTEQ
ncbi:hypothetical protein BGZ73_005151 [Actinomortierella ambigua]|nr:hypothetical protein BGZ73_005151 [Actinomortierella ambigua]